MAPVRKNKVKKTKQEEEEIVAAPVVSGQLDKKLKKQAKQKQQKIAKQRGVVFIKHLPHGFFEKQLRDYFAQFGSVTNVRLSRSKRTGGSKGFAFVEFDIPEVAQVAAETMNNYLMFKKVTKAAYIPPEEQRFNYFKTSVKKITNKVGKEKYVSNTTMNIQRKVKQQNNWTDEAYQKRTKANLLKLKKLNEKYAHLGIDFSKFAVEPKLSTEDEPKAEVETEEPAKKKSKKAQPTKKADDKAAEKLTLPETVATLQKKQQKKTAKPTKAADKSLQLEDLLGNTIAEDSGDDDYEPIDEGEVEEDEEASSDEETYGFSKSDSTDDDEDDDDDEEDDADEEPEAKPVKANKRFEQMLKRKPHSGAIQKFSKKSLKKPSNTIVAKTKKTALVAEAVKKAAKPLKSVQKGPKKTAGGKRQTV